MYLFRGCWLKNFWLMFILITLSLIVAPLNSDPTQSSLAAKLTWFEGVLWATVAVFFNGDRSRGINTDEHSLLPSVGVKFFRGRSKVWSYQQRLILGCTAICNMHPVITANSCPLIKTKQANQKPAFSRNNLLLKCAG